MLFLTILSFAVLLAISYRIHQSWLCPSLVFTGTWLISLIGIFISGDSLYEISGYTYLIYLLGAFSLSLGGAVGLSVSGGLAAHFETIPPRRPSRLSYRALVTCLIVLLVGLPYYWQKQVGAADSVTDELLLQNLRYKAVEESDFVASSIDIVNNFVVLAQFLAMAMFYEMDGSRGRRWLGLCAIILAVVYGGMTGTKGNMVILFLTLFFISSTENRHMRIGALLWTLTLAILSFSFGLLMIDFAYKASSDVGDTVISLVETVQNYWLGGLVAFDQIAQNPDLIISTQPIYRFFVETASSLGMNVYLPPKHAAFLAISPILHTNIYTIYFSYFKDLGWTGTVVVMIGLGVILSMLYKQAMRGGVIAVIFYANMCVALVFSLNAEHFFLGLNGYIKMLIFLVFIYKILPMLERRTIVNGMRNA